MPSSCSSEANYRGTRPSESIHHTCPIPKNQPTDPLLLTLYPTWCHSHYRIRLLLPCLVSQQSFLRVFPYTMYRFGKRVSESSMAVYSNDHNCTRPPLTLKYLKRLTFLLVLCCVLGELHLCSFIDSLEKRFRNVLLSFAQRCQWRSSTAYLTILSLMSLVSQICVTSLLYRGILRPMWKRSFVPLSLMPGLPLELHCKFPPPPPSPFFSTVFVLILFKIAVALLLSPFWLLSSWFMNS